MYFTVITPTRVIRVRAKSPAHLTQALRDVGIGYLAIEPDRD